jgi:LacI family transcriptional regulator
MASKKNITLDVIAKKAGVNASTVSRALNPLSKGHVSKAQREKIFNICRELNYWPAMSAKALASGKTYKIGVILGAIEEDLCSPIIALTLRGLASVLQENGYAMTILWAGENYKKLSDSVANFLYSDIADGYVLGTVLIGTRIVEVINSISRPVVALASSDLPSRTDNVTIIKRDMSKAYRALWRQIKGRISPGEIVFCGIDKKFTRERLQNFKQIAGELNIDASKVGQIFYNFEKNGFMADRRNGFFFAESYFEELMKYKLIISYSDLTALGICDCLRQHGIEPGKDIFIAGQDNIEDFPYKNPEAFLSTLDTCSEARGRLLGEVILKKVKDRDISCEPVSIDAEYIIRKSFPA